MNFFIDQVVDFDFLIFSTSNHVVLIFGEEKAKDWIGMYLFDFIDLDSILQRNDLNSFFTIISHIKEEIIIAKAHQLKRVLHEFGFVFKVKYFLMNDFQGS